jgi:hypothetical protein
MARTQRTRTRVKRNRTANQAVSHTAADNQAEVLEVVQNRRYVAFVRAIIGAARTRNASR